MKNMFSNSGVVAWKIKRLKSCVQFFSSFLTTSIIMHLTSIKAKKINEKKTKPDFILYGQFHAPSRKDFSYLACQQLVHIVCSNPSVVQNGPTHLIYFVHYLQQQKFAKYIYLQNSVFLKNIFSILLTGTCELFGNNPAKKCRWFGPNTRKKLKLWAL